MQIHMALRQRRWSGRIARLPLSGFFQCFFVFFSSRPQLAPLDRFWRSIRHMTFFEFAHGCAFWGFRWYRSTFRGSNPKNLPKRAWIGVFQPNRQKIKNVLSPQLFKISRWNFAQWYTAPVSTLPNSKMSEETANILNSPTLRTSAILWNKKFISKTLIKQQILHRKNYIQAVHLRLYTPMLYM